MKTEDEKFLDAIFTKSCEVNRNAHDKGFYIKDEPLGVKIALMHSELSEALENVRAGCPKSDKLPDFTGLEEEFADCVIRIMDTSRQYDLRLGEAILEKVKYNANRPFMHGKKF